MFLPEWELMGLPGWNHEDGRFRSLGKLIFRSSFLSKFNLDSGFGIRYDRFIRALMNHERNNGFVPLPFTGCDSYNPIRIMFSISWFPFHSRSSSSFPLHAETVLQHYYPGL